jgi:hypothetical protein
VIRIGVLVVCFLAISAFAADMSIIGRLRQYGSHIQSEVRSTPNGDPANRWQAPSAPKVNPVSGDEAKQALTAFRLFCASAPQAPSLQCATLLRHSR